MSEKDKVNAKESGEKVHIHTTLSEYTNNLIDKYKDLTDKDGNYIFKKKKTAVIERAVELLDNYYNPKKNNERTIWCRAREELNMLLVGKTTFLSYIAGNVEKAYTNNIAIEVIEWYLGKRIEEINLEEFLNGLKNMWQIANYFYKIDLEKNTKGSFQMRFNHELTKNYSSFWAGYFETLLTEYWNCSVEPFIRTESFYLIIKEKE